MALFGGQTLIAAASTTLDAGELENAAASPRRLQLVELDLGSHTTPGDNPFDCELRRRTGVPTAGTAYTAMSLDENDTIAATAVLTAAPTGNGAAPGTDNALLSIAMNSRTTFRWFAIPGREIVSVATASHGWGLRTPTAGGTPGLIVGWVWNEL